MKLKTPLFLALVIGPIMAIILVIWPDFKEIEPKKAELAASEALVASIRQKNSNIDAMSQSLDDPQNSARKDFVMKYIPLEKKEERIFNSINSIANAEGVKVALSNISLKEGKDKVVPAVAEVPLDGAGSGSAQASVLPTAKTIVAEIAAVGSYGSQKNFIAKIYAMDMMKKISGFTLTSSGESADVLDGMVEVEFAFIPEAKIGKNYGSPIFNQASFDFGPVEKLISHLYEKTIEVVVGGEGRTNPFLP